jgi:hypothetical protein
MVLSPSTPVVPAFHFPKRRNAPAASQKKRSESCHSCATNMRRFVPGIHAPYITAQLHLILAPRTSLRQNIVRG